LEEEFQKQDKVTCVHDKGSLDISHVGPASFTSNMFQRVVSHGHTDNHLKRVVQMKKKKSAKEVNNRGNLIQSKGWAYLSNLGQGNDDGVEPLKK